VHHLVQQHARIAPEGQFARQQLIEDDAQAVDITPPIDSVRFATSLFRTHISGRTQELAFDRHGDFACLALGQAKVHQVRRAVVTHHDVRRLDIAMDHALIMGILQGLGHHRRQLGSLARR
jgi:hypothetical protein